jgi:hypothetical protein
MRGGRVLRDYQLQIGNTNCNRHVELLEIVVAVPYKARLSMMEIFTSLASRHLKWPLFTERWMFFLEVSCET